MIKGYRNDETRVIAEGGKLSKQVSRVLPPALHQKARIKLAALDAAENLETLRAYPGLNLKKMGRVYQMRINDTYRVRFAWDGKDADDVEIGDFHK